MPSLRASRRVQLEHLVATDAARSRLARAAFDVVVDGIDLGPCALRSAADRAWVRVAIAGPIQRSADRALGRLVEDLAEALAGGDPDLVARILRMGPSPADVTGADDDFDRLLTGRRSSAPIPVMQDTRVAVLR